MSGTSLDGADLASCTFSKNEMGWTYEISHAVTIEYNNVWLKKLSSIHKSDAEELVRTHVEFGAFLGGLAKEFVVRNQLAIDFISSHGHTVFHQPQHRFTFQMGDGAALSASSGYPVVCDFRSKDVALGGQGAPLVPIGDELLFSAYDFCLNLGGIANISFKKKSERIAFDVVPCNMVLNKLSLALGKKYDDEGSLAEKGIVQEQLLSKLNAIGFYHGVEAGPKSLGREDVEKDFFPIINASTGSTEDKLRTFCEHIAIQISKVIALSGIEPGKQSKLFITGGGALNRFLVQRISELSKITTVIPENKIIDYKEALIFAFLGVLRWRNEINCLKSVTGASVDHVGGAVYL